MTTRARRQTRQRRFDTPPGNWPTEHNRAVAQRKAYRRLDHRIRRAAASWSVLASAMISLAPAFKLAAERIAKLEQAIARVSHLGVTTNDVLEEASRRGISVEDATGIVIDEAHQFSDVMAARGWDMREDTTNG